MWMRTLDHSLGEFEKDQRENTSHVVCFPGMRRNKKKSKKSKNASKRNEVKNEEQSTQPKIKQQQQRQFNRSRNESSAGDLVELMKWRSAAEQQEGEQQTASQMEHNEEHVDVNVVKLKDGDVTQNQDSDIDPDKKSQTDILEVIQDRKGHSNLHSNLHSNKGLLSNDTLVTEEEGKVAKESSVVEVIGATKNRVPNLKYKGLKEHKTFIPGEVAYIGTEDGYKRSLQKKWKSATKLNESRRKYSTFTCL